MGGDIGSLLKMEEQTTHYHFVSKCRKMRITYSVTRHPDAGTERALVINGKKKEIIRVSTVKDASGSARMDTEDGYMFKLNLLGRWGPSTLNVPNVKKTYELEEVTESF